MVQDAETVLLGHSNDVESTAQGNLAQCKQAMATGSNGAWESWLRGRPETITAGECLNPLTYTLFDYLDLGVAFHLNVPLCAEDVAVVKATEADRYRVQDKGPWINATGDPELPTHAVEAYPCNTEGCYAGMIMGRFTGTSGIQSFFPIGLSHAFRAPEDGTLSIGINDHVVYDNAWYKSGGVVDHTGIEVSPQ